MVNLLFITSNSKINGIIEALQPFFKVKIDLVADFDFGLKDVFEKRPATVFIQDQIAGVTGESVARHIQMLLGSGSPSFIFMHDGSTKAKPINGLFEHLIDLSQPNPKIVTAIIETLKVHFGPQWEKVFVPSRTEITPIPDSAVLFPNISELQEKSSNNSSSNLNPFKSTTSEHSVEPSIIEQSVNSAFESFDVVSSPQEQLAEMLAASEDKPAFARAGKDIVDVLLSTEPHSCVDVEKTPLRENRSANVVMRNEERVKSTAPIETSAPKIGTVTSKGSDAKLGKSSIPRIQTVDEQESLQKQEPADFIIVGERTPGQVAPEDLLRVFEGCSRSGSTVGIKTVLYVVLFFILVAAAYWYFGKNFHTLNIFSKKPVKASVTPTVPNSPETLPVPLKQDIIPAKPSDLNVLPTFVPKSGLDSAYSVQKPGWERYVDSSMDCRLYRNAGKIKAVQVLGVHDSSLKESLMKSILIELTGFADFRVKTRNVKNGFNVEQAVIAQDVDLLVYRKNREIKAFVVSLN
jgi:flagellar FliL protein